jgi:hypothetical protein
VKGEEWMADKEQGKKKKVKREGDLFVSPFPFFCGVNG